MKMKLWQWEWEFDKDDARIVIPLVLLVFGLAWTQVRKEVLLAGAGVYYLLYFFLKPVLLGIRDFFRAVHHWVVFRCPYCRSRDVFLQGYQGYHGDQEYGYHLCNHCKETSIEVRSRLIKATQRKLK